MDNSLETLKLLYENSCQKIVLCRDTRTEESFIHSTIINQKLMKLIDVNFLNSTKSNIVKAYKTSDRLYIITRYFEELNQFKLKEFIDNNKLSLKHQFVIAEQLLRLFLEVYNTTDLFQYKIVNFDNLTIDDELNIYVNGGFEFTDEFDLSDNFTYKSIGNMLHYVLSKKEIVDYNLSDEIHPDLIKIVVKCLTREYFHPKDILKEFIGSSIYNLINCKTDAPVNSLKMSDVYNIEVKNDEMQKSQSNEENPKEDDKSTVVGVAAAVSATAIMSTEAIADEKANEKITDTLDASDAIEDLKDLELEAETSVLESVSIENELEENTLEDTSAQDIDDNSKNIEETNTIEENALEDTSAQDIDDNSKNIEETNTIEEINTIEHIDDSNYFSSIQTNLDNDEKLEGSEINDSEKSDEDAEVSVIDIFLKETDGNKSNTNDNVKSTTYSNNTQKSGNNNGEGKSKIKIIIIAAVAIVLLLGSIAFGLGLFGDKEDGNGSDIVDNTDNGTDGTEQNVQPDSDDKDDENQNPDDTNTEDDNPDKDDSGDVTEPAEPVIDNAESAMFFNSDLISKIGYTGATAVVDTSNYNEGSSSLLIENNSEETVKSLFAIIDFDKTELEHMRGEQIVFTAKFNALQNTEVKLIVEAYKDGVLFANNSGKIEVANDIWTSEEVTINVGEIDYINLYLEVQGNNKIWIDGMQAYVAK